MTAPDIFFEDLTPGTTFTFEGPTISKDEIVAFASEFDPQPFHLDEEAARQSFLGELVASGWHTCALTMRLLAEGLILRSSSMGAPGIEEVKWLRPVRPGDRLSLKLDITGNRVPRSRPDRGFVHNRIEVRNQRGQIVMTQVFWAMFGRRDPSAPAAGPETATAPERASPATIAQPEPAEPGASSGGFSSSFDAIVLGQTHDLGSLAFTPDDIVRFARAFDPQPFHVDAEAAKLSHFGGLCASGWHTAAGWMKCMMESRARQRKAALAREQPVLRFGPSPGFKDLRWLKPVYAGDTITYRSTAVGKRASASRPGWGLVSHHNTGDNQHGERVFEFTGSVFWERGPAPD